MNTPELLTLATQAGYFISAFAAISAAIIMTTVTKKLGGGVLAAGFRIMSIGIGAIAAGIIVDALANYIGFLKNGDWVSLTMIKEMLFVIGTYSIVIGSKRIVDQLKSLAA